jgi:hypothetical protein
MRNQAGLVRRPGSDKDIALMNQAVQSASMLWGTFLYFIPHRGRASCKKV